MHSVTIFSKFDETLLVRRLRGGDEAAFADLYDRYAAMMLGAIAKMVADQADAENLLQDSFVKIWKNIATYDASKGRLSTWVLNIARHTAIDFLRSKAFAQKQKHQPIEQVVAGKREPGQPGVQEDGIGLWEMVQKMAQPYREVIHWMYFEGFTQQEIAERFDLPLGTVKTRTRMALRNLRELFELS